MTIDLATLSKRIQERFPQGLTGIFALGGTRTSYILQKNRHAADPGKIRDLADYTEYGLQKTREFIQMYFDLGGQNMILELLDIYRFHERGDTYADAVTQASLKLIDADSRRFYTENQIDPYFVGIDTLLHLPETSAPHQLGAAYQAFHQEWQYQAGRRRLIWEVAPIPLYSFHFADDVMGTEARQALDASIRTETDLEALYGLLYRYYARASYYTDLPMPDFYLASNRNGDIKPRAVLPFGLLCGGGMRIYTVPYPSFFMTREGLGTILDDLLNDKRFRSLDTDYRGRLTPDKAQALYDYFQDLSANPQTTLGLTRALPIVNQDDDD